MKLNAQVIEKMQSVNLDAVDKETLVDASGFVFDNSLPLEKRAARMLEQLKNPYCFRYGDMAIKLEFAEDGPSLQELLTGFFLRQKSGLLREFTDFCIDMYANHKDVLMKKWDVHRKFGMYSYCR